MDEKNGFQIPTDNGKTSAIVSYITIIGWLIAYFSMYKNNKTSLAAYHLRQSLLLNIIAIGLYVIRSLSFSAFWGSGLFSIIMLLMTLLNLALFILWLMGLISAINEREKPIPVLGDMAQKMFQNI